MLARYIDRGIRGAAEINADSVWTIRPDLREAVLDLVVFAFVRERLVAGPFQPHDVEDFGCTSVAFVLVIERIAVLAQLRRIAAGDHVQCDAAARGRVKRQECTIEAGVFVRFRRRFDMGPVQDRPVADNGFR